MLVARADANRWWTGCSSITECVLRWQYAEPASMLGPMAGKAPLLLASVLFIVGAVGLALTSAERAEWGPFEPHVQVAPEQHFVISAADVAFVDPTPLEGLLAVAVQPPAVEQPAAVALVLADPDPEPE